MTESFTTPGRNPDVCISCGTDQDVEAGGIYYCPNVFCTVTGAFHLRMKAGYHDEEGNQSEEQHAKWLSDCRAEIATVEKRLAMLKRCAERIAKR